MNLLQIVADVFSGVIIELHHLIGVLAQQQVLLHLLLFQFLSQVFLLLAKRLFHQLSVVALPLSPGSKVTVVNVLKVLGDGILIVAVRARFLLRAVREIAVLETERDRLSLLLTALHQQLPGCKTPAP